MTTNDVSQQAIAKILDQMDENLSELSWFDCDLKDDKFVKHMAEMRASLKAAKKPFVEKDLVIE
ncbi:hypothetical protein [Secundilactobacillus silagei]|uniref:Uncharacterized protein n=1 Tax=Secundilactobacillus silagei JCM 19001 TaxID=1302250 RepID=A0A1Z5H3Y0_9LACO|nr:hypothetical protein [Secundilactobacillus silagei]TDG70228.1 hypothetical protein C5L25_001418 [Secundilactobacillus silagei JCM 19001]GAT18000.1 hypothetical protein IWT126_00257 [Secundilactobacillus silagei JCM 19001]